MNEHTLFYSACLYTERSRIYQIDLHFDGNSFKAQLREFYYQDRINYINISYIELQLMAYGFETSCYDDDRDSILPIIHSKDDRIFRGDHFGDKGFARYEVKYKEQQHGYFTVPLNRLFRFEKFLSSAFKIAEDFMKEKKDLTKKRLEAIKSSGEIYLPLTQGWKIWKRSAQTPN